MSLTSAEKSARYRAKDVDAYRQAKRELAKTAKHRETRCLYMQGWRARNREKHNSVSRRYAAANRERVRLSNLKRYYRIKYGLSVEQAVALRRSGCEICGSHKKLHIDHDHSKLGTYRGVLCMRCNTGLGWYERWVAGIRQYVERVRE